MFLYFSVVVNLVFLYFAYLVHFKSLDLSNRKECGEVLRRQTDRIVLFVPQGLGADHLFSVIKEDGRKHSFLRRIMEGEGVWGISRTGTRSDSQGGNVALISGVAYDSSLIWSYCKLVKYKLDHIFNKVDDVFFFGDTFIPDLINAKDNPKYRVETWSKELKDGPFAGGKDFAYDEFTFDRLDIVLRNISQTNSNRIAMYVFYLPGVKICTKDCKTLHECVSTVVNLDREIEKAYWKFKHYFSDSRTSFILTSNQGTSKTWSEDEKSYEEEIPFLAWGAGIKNVEQVNRNENLNRVDMPQVAVAPVISTLFGLETPNNSVGVIPRRIFDINQAVSSLLFCNENQINELVLKYAEETGNNEYLEKLPHNTANITNLRNLLNQKMILGKSPDVVTISNRLFVLHQDQIKYYKLYLKPLLWIVLTVLYMGFAFWSLERVALSALISENDFGGKKSIWVRLNTGDFTKREFIYDIAFAIAGFCITAFVFFKHFPIYFVLSFPLATLIWWRVFKNAQAILGAHSGQEIIQTFGIWFLYSSIGTIWLVLGIYSSITRQLLLGAIAVTVLFTVSPLVENVVQVLYIVLAAVLAYFQNFYIGYEPDMKGLIIGAISWIIAMGFYVYYNKRPLRDVGVVFVYIVLTASGLWNAISIMQYGHKSYNILLSWIILTTSPLFPIIASQKGIKRLCHIGFSLCGSFVLLSVFQEVLGLFVYSAYLFVVYIVESRNSYLTAQQRRPKTRKQLDKEDLKRGYFLLAFIWFGYFATGNTNYPNSLEQKWTSNFVENSHHLVPVIGLTVFKLLVPLGITCSMFGLLYKEVNASINHLLEWFLFLNTVVSWYFFILSKGEGYPLKEIALSVNNLVISHVFSIAVIVLTKTLGLYNSIDLQKFFNPR